MTKTQSTKCRTPFRGPFPFAWNHVPIGGIPTRERCQAISTEAERRAAVKLVQAYRAQEAISAEHNIENMSRELEEMARTSRTAHGGVPGEMLRRQIRAADHGVYLGAEEELAKLRNEALELAKGFLKRLVASFDEALSVSALEAEKRIEAESLPLIEGDSWTLHHDGVCQALWFRRVKAQKVLDELHPDNAIGAVQFYLTNEELVPFSWL